MHLFFELLSIGIRLAFVAAAGAFALVRGLFNGLVLTGQVVHAHHRLSQGLRCGRGHLLETEGATYSCGACGYTYEGGSQWVCPNPECGATTPYVNCWCGLSVSSPYRFLHR